MPLYPETRPREFRLRLTQLLNFPRRFCHPPDPSVPKVRSCSVVPSVRVSLDDIINRRHLPPIGLKDFEEWLLYVEQRAQYLYFILWLRDYSAKYRAWCKEAKPHPPSMRDTRPVSRPLSIFFTRAKQTFFTESSPYHLKLPPGIVDPIMKPLMDSKADSPHPDPSVFSVIELEVRELLNASLRRFVRAAFSNVATYRATCGVLGGSFIFTVFGILPYIFLLLHLSTRWFRLVALPGMIVGMAIVIASLHGLCVGIYVFGDVRQLHSFELARPPISKPAPLALKAVLQPLEPAVFTPNHWFIGRWYTTHVNNSASHLTMTTLPSGRSRKPTLQSTDPQQIYVSEAIDLPSEEASTVEIDDLEAQYRLEPSTAVFIKPVEILPMDTAGDGGESCAVQQTELDEFDFNGLPHYPQHTTRSAESLQRRNSEVSCRSCPASTHAASVHSDAGSQLGRDNQASATSSIDGGNEEQFRYDNVPAFGPLTPVYSPLVRRAYWEILFRATVISTVICSGLMAGLLVIPQQRK